MTDRLSRWTIEEAADTDMPGPRENLLPESSRVYFQANRLENHRVAMRSSLDSDVADHQLLERYAYIVHEANDPAGIVKGEQKTFYAERYGSLGRLSHAGGARVGTDEYYQVKGIGRTPVCSALEMDFAYSNGELSVVEAMRELIWGEVLSVVLPYGAVRSVAVIDTLGPCRQNDGSPDLMRSRGLLVRQRSVRPAHFFRSIFSHAPSQWQWEPDASRLREATSLLANILPFGGVTGAQVGPPRAHSLEEVMLEFCRRLADQLATARTRRILHGSLTASNLTVDGRWLDFDSTTRPPVHGSMKDYVPAFWDDHSRIENVITDFCFYANKYGNVSEEICSANMLTHFRSMLEVFKIKRSIELFGFPQYFLDQLPSDFRPALAVLSSIAHRIVRQGRERPFAGDEAEFSSFGKYRAMDIALWLVTRRDASTRNILAERVPPKWPMAGELVDAYSKIFDACQNLAVVKGWKPESLGVLIVINIVNKQRRFRILEGNQLSDELNRLFRKFGSGDRFYRSTAAIGRSLITEIDNAFSDHGSGFARFQIDGRSCAVFDCRKGGITIAGASASEVIPTTSFTADGRFKRWVSAASG